MPRPSFIDFLTKAVSPSAGAASSLAVVHAGITYRVAIKRVGTARRFTLRVRASTQDALLTMPPRASMRTARSFAERHAEWIGTRLQALPGRLKFEPEAIVPLRGVAHRVVHDPVRRSLKRVGVEPAVPGCDDAMPVLRVSGAPDEVGRHLYEFLRREAHQDLKACVERHTSAIAKPCRRIAVRDTRSRWGSCSSKGNLNFSWRLIMAPPFVLDYLAAHECAHLCHMDHSAAFWAVTERLAPQTSKAEAWLKSQGATLHLYSV